MIKQALKVGAIFSLMTAFGLHSAAQQLIFRDPKKLRRRRTELLQKYSKLGLEILDIEVINRLSLVGQEKNYLFAGNHLSYLDVLVISAQRPTCFVTSEEIRQTPVLGWLCEIAGCLFVERRSRARLGAEVIELSEALISGVSVTIFPEATSTDGTEVLRFRRALFQAAINALRDVKPFCINYLSISGQPVGPKNRDIVCWYGSMDFVPHLWSLAGESNIKVSLSWLPTISVFTENVLMTADAIALASHKFVSQSFRSLAVENYPEEVIKDKTDQELMSWPVPEGG